MHLLPLWVFMVCSRLTVTFTEVVKYEYIESIKIQIALTAYINIYIYIYVCVCVCVCVCVFVCVQFLLLLLLCIFGQFIKHFTSEVPQDTCSLVRLCTCHVLFRRQRSPCTPIHEVCFHKLLY
jgi:hypothetical protein